VDERNNAKKAKDFQRATSSATRFSPPASCSKTPLRGFAGVRRKVAAASEPGRPSMRLAAEGSPYRSKFFWTD
jgi:hypothetical protein